MRIAAWAVLTLSFSHLAAGQHRLDPVARSAGGVWLRGGGDPWCVLGAPPLLASVRRTTVGLAHFPSPWGLDELSGSVAVIAVPAGGGALGASLARSGFDLFAETYLGIAYGGATGALRYGITARYRHLRIERYGSTGIPSIAAVPCSGGWLQTQAPSACSTFPATVRS